MPTNEREVIERLREALTDIPRILRGDCYAHEHAAAISDVEEALALAAALPAGTAEATTQEDSMQNVLDMIAVERERQVAKGYGAVHDDEHVGGEIAHAAACYAVGLPAFVMVGEPGYGGAPEPIWPWPDVAPPMRGRDGEEVDDDERINQLVVAGALVVAEIERLQRKVEREDG